MRVFESFENDRFARVTLLTVDAAPLFLLSSRFRIGVPRDYRLPATGLPACLTARVCATIAAPQLIRPCSRTPGRSPTARAKDSQPLVAICTTMSLLAQRELYKF